MFDLWLAWRRRTGIYWNLDLAHSRENGKKDKQFDLSDLSDHRGKPRKPWKSYERAKKEGGLDKQTQQVRGNETNASFIITSFSRAKVLSSSDFVYIVGCKREKGFSNFHIEIIKKIEIDFVVSVEKRFLLWFRLSSLRFIETRVSKPTRWQ